MLSWNPDSSRDADRNEFRMFAELRARLSGDAVDLVLVDLTGAVATLLDLIDRLRATAGPKVVFVGILPSGIDPVARLYLSAVMDIVVESSKLDAGRDSVITRAIEAELHADAGSVAVAKRATLH